MDIFVCLVNQMGLKVKIIMKMSFTYIIVNVFLRLFLHVSKIEKASGGGSVGGRR